MMQYKGYTGRVDFDDEADLFHGEVLGLRDVVTFQGRTVEEVKQAFRDSVDDYLEFCAKRGEQPEKPFTGKLMVRLPPELHRKVYVAAKQAGTSVNAWISSESPRCTALNIRSPPAGTCAASSAPNAICALRVPAAA